MPKLKINEAGVKNFIKKRTFNTYIDIICELSGCVPGAATLIYYDIIKNNFVQTINDDGLKPDDMHRLIEYFNGGNNGHSEWGMGCRVAARQLLEDSESTENKFYILDNKQGIVFILEDDDLEFQYLDKENVKRLNQTYSSQIDINNSCNFTKWIIPVGPKFQNKDINDIQNDMKLRYSMPILKKEIKIYFNNEILDLKTQPYEINNWDNIEIVYAKKIKNDTAKGNPQYMYKINDTYYSKSGEHLEKEKKCEVINIKYSFEASIYYPKTEQIKSLGKELGMNETLINGVLISKKNVLKSTNFNLLKGQRFAGTKSDEHKIICLKDENNTLSKSTIEKNNKPILDNCIKEFVNCYQHFYKKTKNITKNKSKSNLASEKKTQDDYINNSKSDNTNVISNIHNDLNDLITTEENESDVEPEENESDTDSLVEDKNCRNHLDNISKNNRSKLYEENREYFAKKNECPRCPCCDRKILINNFHSGHIKSVKCGGTNELQNGLAICNKCNGNDTRNITNMVEEEWGKDHTNYKNLYKILNTLGKTIPQD